MSSLSSTASMTAVPPDWAMASAFGLTRSSGSPGTSSNALVTWVIVSRTGSTRGRGAQTVTGRLSDKQHYDNYSERGSPRRCAHRAQPLPLGSQRAVGDSITGAASEDNKLVNARRSRSAAWPNPSKPASSRRGRGSRHLHGVHAVGSGVALGSGHILQRSHRHEVVLVGEGVHGRAAGRRCPEMDGAFAQRHDEVVALISAKHDLGNVLPQQ